MWRPAARPTLRSVHALLLRATMRVAAVHDRWVANGYPAFPLWIPALIHSVLVLGAAVTVLQRMPDDVPLALALVVLALLPWTAALRGRVAPVPLFWLVTGGSTLALMHLAPVEYDVAPFLLVLMVGEIGACRPLLSSGLLAAATVPLVALAALDGGLPVEAAGVWMAAIVIGWDVGFIMRFQQLRVEEGERTQAERARQAALEERQRIAREIHDLVAHSLSVTMLHLTAARRDLEDGGDPAEIAEALHDAERIGRQAMSDIRGVVGVLGQQPDTRRALPGLADLPALADDFRLAGLDVVLDLDGLAAVSHALEGEPGDDVPQATGLALYRIVQESLANVAKHAPGSRALVRLDLDRDHGLLTVRNTLPASSRGRVRGDGAGLRGMAERAELMGARFSAGPEGRLWTVRVVLPRAAAGASGPLPLRCPLPALATIRRVVTQ